MVSDETLVARMIDALDSPHPPRRDWWARPYSKTDEQIDLLFDLAIAQREIPRAEIAALKALPEGGGD
jgi:hypothetical protein